MKNNLIKSAFVVFATWWVMCTIYAFYKNGVSTVDEFEASAYIAFMVILGGVFGSVFVYLVIKAKKDSKSSELRPDNYNGLLCTVGEVPIVIPAPLRKRVPISFAYMHAVAKDVPDEYFVHWERKYIDSHPAHVRLFSALVAILMYDETIPATHVPGGHGNRTLLEHSLLAAYIMDELAKKYQYHGLLSSKNNKKILDLTDTDYEFKKDDPLLALIGLAHDIGKIETYIKDKANCIVGIKAEHDLTGGRMLARIDEVWDLPEADRRALIMSVSHYHHPMSLPLSPSRKAVDDRTIAVMELLINADTAVSAIEARSLKLSNFEIKGIEEDQQADSDDEIDSVEDDQIYAYIVQCIKEKGRINNSDTRYNIGTYCQVRGFNKPMLLLRDDSLRNLVMQKLGVTVSEDTPGGVTQMGARIRSILDNKGILIKEIRDRKYNAQYALWSVSFLARESAGAEPKVVSSWKAVNIIDASRIPGLVNLKPYHWMGDVQDGVFKGSRTVKIDAGKANDYEGLSPDEASEHSSDEAMEIARSVGIEIDVPNPVSEPKGDERIQEVANVVAKTASSGFNFSLADDNFESQEQELQIAVQGGSASTDLARDFTDVFSALIGGECNPTILEVSSQACEVPQTDENAPLPTLQISPDGSEEDDASVPVAEPIPAIAETEISSLVAVGEVEPHADPSAALKYLRKQYQPNKIQGLIVDVVKKLLAENKKPSEHVVHGYLLSSNTLVSTFPEVPWIDLEPVLREYCDKGKAAYKIHEPKAGNTAFVITIDKDLI